MSERQIDAAGIGLRVLDEGEGEPVMLIHGFPDSSRVWRRQIPALTAAGYRIIAPDLRGFGESEVPATVEEFTVDLLLADLTGILNASGLESAHVVGHDWGASLAWALAGSYPGRVRSLTALSVGHPQSLYSAGFEQREKAWYTLLFLFEGTAEKILSRNDWRFAREWLNNHEELAHWIGDLERPGRLTAALNIYRANTHPAQTFAEHSFPRIASRTMGVWSSGDTYLTEAQMRNSAAYVDGSWRYERLAGAGHWMQLDDPERVNLLLLEFLASSGRATRRESTRAFGGRDSGAERG